MVSANVEGCGIGNDGVVSTGYALQFPNESNCPFEDREVYEVIGSFDPNDLQAFPRGFGNEHFIEPTTEIEYLIRFQNVGNDTAFNVFILDTLSSFLDPSTITIEDYSHQYQLEVKEGGIMEFSFFDILLVDSIANEPSSHGFIKFRIASIENVSLGSIIYNQAAIVFDFNEAVLTNTLFHTINTNFYPDEAPPFWSTSPENLQLECGNEIDLAIEEWLTNNGGGSVQDDSGEVIVNNDYENIIYICGQAGSVAVTFLATDTSGNSSERIAFIQIEDTSPPQWEILPHELIIDCNLNLVEQINTWLGAYGGGLVSDNCGSVSISNNFSDTIDCMQTDTIPITFYAQDECENTNEAFTFIIIDNINDLSYLSLDSELSIFPNPANKTVRIAWKESNNLTNYSIKIFNLAGGIVYHNRGLSQTIEVPTQEWQEGIYFIQLILEGEDMLRGRFLKN